MTRWTTQWFLSLQIALYLLLIFAQGNKEAEEAYRNGRNLVLEYFLPINLPTAVNNGLPRRVKRDVEGSGEDDPIFSEISEKDVEEINNSTKNNYAKLFLPEGLTTFSSNSPSLEGSGEVNEVNENDIFQVSSSEEDKEPDEVPVISETESLKTTEQVENAGTENGVEVVPEVTSTEMIFDKSEDFGDVKAVDTATTSTDDNPAVILGTTTVGNYEEVQKIYTDNFQEENSTKHLAGEQDEVTTSAPQESTTPKFLVTVLPTGIPTEIFTDATVVSNVINQENISKNNGSSVPETTTEEIREFFTTPPSQITTFPFVVPRTNETENIAKTEIIDLNSPTAKEMTETPKVSETALTTLKPVIEEIFKENIHKKLEAMPGNILQKQNLSLAADPLLITNTRLIDSEETVKLSSSEPKRLGAYIIIGLILLSFSSLVGYITFRRRMNRKRLEFESNQESNDTEKALLSLSDYKDSSELEENHLKNNEITPIVVKSNSQINKFEKNTNFSSPKNLNTTANEKNIEKDNVLKSTAENLTQVIIEGSPKDVEEEKNAPNMEKLIVKTRIDQDSIPKKPIIINRSSTGYVPIPQDNV